MLLPSRAAKRYAAVLFAVAGKAEAWGAVHAEAIALQQTLRDSPELRRALANYRVGASARQRMLHGLFDGRMHPMMFRFTLFVESKKRLGLLADICDDFLRRYDRHAGVVRGRLDSAFPMGDETVRAIRAWAQPRISGELSLTAAVDPALYGGFRLRVEDRVYDLSVAGQLRRLREQMMSA